MIYRYHISMLTSFLGNVARVYTIQNYQFESMTITPDENYVTFRVRTCGDVHLILYAEEESDEMYEIALGKNNRKIELYRRPDDGLEASRSVDTWQLFDCVTFRCVNTL